MNTEWQALKNTYQNDGVYSNANLQPHNIEFRKEEK